MLSAALAAPDHGRQRPWRFVLLSGKDKDAFADVLEEAYRAQHTGPEDPGRIARERGRLDRAPLIIVTTCPSDHDSPIPRHERLASTAAATQNLLLAATAVGFGSIWRTGWPSRNGRVKKTLGLDEDDDIVAFVYLGTVPNTGRLGPRPARTPTGLSWTWPRDI